MLNVLVGTSVCTDYTDSEWSSHWSSEVVKVLFTQYDRNSDFYSLSHPLSGKNQLLTSSLTKYFLKFPYKISLLRDDIL